MYLRQLNRIATGVKKVFVHPDLGKPQNMTARFAEFGVPTYFVVNRKAFAQIRIRLRGICNARRSTLPFGESGKDWQDVNGGWNHIGRQLLGQVVANLFYVDIMPLS